MSFYIAAIAMGVGVALILVLSVLRARTSATDETDKDIRIYRDQLRDVERDVARGTVSAADAERVRTEISRRILEADRSRLARTDSAESPAWANRLLAGAIALVLVVGAGTAYWRLGAPGYRDLPLRERIAIAEEMRANRPSQAQVEAEAPARAEAEPTDPRYKELMDKLRATVAERPDDLQGLMLLARNEAGLGNFKAAYAAQARVIAAKGDAATAEDYAALAELMILTTGGYISPEAEKALTESLRRDPANGTARYYSGLALAQTGRPDLAFPIWRSLLEGSTPDAPWVPAITAQIGELAAQAGVAYTPPTTGKGPSAADVAAAGAMSDNDRQAMIRGMVGQLSDRLATEGGPASEWAKLITAYGVLGETDRAREIYTEAQTRFEGRDSDLATLLSAAQKAGVAP